MWHKKNGRRGFLGSLKSLFNKKPVRKSRKHRTGESFESLEERIVLSAEYVENHVLLGLDPGALESVTKSVAISLAAPEIEPLGNYGVYLMTLGPGIKVPDAINTLRTVPGVRYAEPDWYGSISLTPNDPAYNQVWGLNNTGQTLNGVTGTVDADIDANLAWDITTGSRSIIVAVLDTGVDVNHPDLAANIWQNPGEIANNGLDDDGNGFVDDINGWDFVSNDNRPADGHGHGTHCAGTIGAVGNNGIGLTGVNWNVTIMPVKVFNDFGGGAVSSVINGLNYAVANGAIVSNHSYGFSTYSAAMEAAFNNAGAAGHLSCVAAGNSSTNVDTLPVYPAALPGNHIITVAATDPNDNLASFSSFGVNRVDLGAPGVNVWSTTPVAGGFGYGPNYSFSDGTSMATPMVTGAAALLWSLGPAMNYTTIRTAILQGTETLTSLNNRVATGGRLNVNNAISQLPIADVSISRSTVAENAGTGAATLTIQKIAFPTDQALTLTLNIDDLTEVAVPGAGATVTIPAGSRQVTFPIDILDDTLLDGTQTVTFDILLAGNVIDSATLQVTDFETITVVANPDTVSENAGANAGTLTISRSNTDVFAPNRVAVVNNTLRFYDRTGTQVGGNITVPWPLGVRPGSQTVHDVTVLENGRIAVLNGTSVVYLSTYNRGNNTWSHRLITGAQASASDGGIGGISSVGNYVYLTDLRTSTNDPYGIVRFDTTTNAVTRFGTKAFGDRLFASEWTNSTITELDPLTGATIRSFTTPISSGFNAGLGFDGTFLWGAQTNSNILYKMDPDTGAVLDTFTVNGGASGIACLNGLIYLSQFLTGTVVAYDPVLRTIVRTMPVGAANGFSTIEGLAANPARNSLFVADYSSDMVYEVSPINGVALTRPDGSPRRFATGYSLASEGLAVVGDKVYTGTFDRTLRVFTTDGLFLNTISTTLGSAIGSLGGDGVIGLVDTPYRFRDVAVGMDGYIYGLDTAGLVVGRFDATTLAPISFVTLEEVVRSIAVDENGTIFGGSDLGEILRFNSNAKVAARLSTGLDALADIELNITDDIIVSSYSGSVAYTNTAFAAPTTFATGSANPVFVAFGEHFSRNSGQLTVTLTNSDPTELSIPVSVVIPEGQQTIVIPFDAVDDNFRDGQQTVTITGSATGYVSGTETVTVRDFEGIVVDVVESTVVENAGANASLIRVSRTDIDGPYSYVSSQSFTNSNLMHIPDRGTILSPITVPSQISWLLDVDVTVSFRHSWLADLDVYLISPAGTRVELFTDLASNETNITDAILVDSAATSINSASAPYTGRFMPESRLDALYHEKAAGTWYLEVTDDNTFDVGALLTWSLSLQTEGLAAATVVLTSSDPSEATLGGQAQRTVVIPANQSEITLNLDAVDDTLLDGPQTVVVRALVTDVPNSDLGSDTVTVADYETITFSVSNSNVSEAAGTGALTGTITRLNTDLGLPYTVNLLNSDSSELSVPASVTIPAGSSSVTFPIDAVDDAIIDGTQSVTITLVAPDYVGTKTQTINVEDLEPSLQLSAQATTVPENSGSLEITVRRLDQADLSQPLTVNLVISSVTPGGAALSGPATVTIPGGSDSITFVVSVLDDALLDGTQITRITASQVNVVSGTIDISVTDVETVSLAVDRIEFLENGGAKAAVGTVSRSNTDTSLPLTVSLVSSDTTEARVPATVTIPAGASSVSFDIAAVNDPDLDGPQSVTLTASAVGYVSGSTNVTVLDHEPPVILTPAATTLNARPVITWQAIPGAIRYELIVSNLSTGVNQFINRTNLTGTSFTPSENLGIGRYRTWVRAVDALERPGFWSNPRDFRVETAPSFTAPVVNGTSASATFPEIAWTAVADAARYELWINNVTTGSSRVLYRTDIVTTAYKSLDGFGSGLYRAFVRAANSQNELGQWSAAINFTVLAAPSIVTPATGGSFDRTPTFSWNRIPGATSYDVWVSSRTLNRVYLRNQSVVSNSLTATSDFANGDYTVWVRAQSGQFFSPWSEARNFSVGMPPVITSPAAGSSNSRQPTFAWSSISDTERYELWISDIGRNTRILLTNLTTTSYTPTSALAVGTYRVWVRAVSIMGEFSAWSTPVTFTVASVSPDAAFPLLQLPELTAFKSATERKVAAKPSVASNAAQVVEQSYVSVQAATRANMLAQADRNVIEETSDSAAFDAVMSEWSGAEWWQAPVDVQGDRKGTVKS